MVKSDDTTKKTRRQKAFAVLPTMLTLGNAICGFGAITILARVGPTFDVVPADPPTAGFDPVGEMVFAAYLIFLAMLFDALDGSAARLTNQTSEFGAMLDSLCDVVSFGVAPAFMMLKLTNPAHHLMETLSVPGTTASTSENPIYMPFGYSLDFLWPIAALFLACAILRLARFNVETDEEDDHDGFSGLPSPAAAGVIASFPIGINTLKQLSEKDWLDPVARIALPTLSVLLPFITLATAVLMVSRIRYPHIFNQILKGNRGRKQLLQLVFALALIFMMKARGLVVPVLFCWFAFAGPLRALWLRYVGPLFRRTKAADIDSGVS
ncbi:MAG: phosphatidylcholine/phosphatidylserine synthase [Fuerstiella sp.]|nr:phosphatidylcholine/phosphatidylserine synthase [Fuerstiella sp.]